MHFNFLIAKLKVDYCVLNLNSLYWTNAMVNAFTIAQLMY